MAEMAVIGLLATAASTGVAAYGQYRSQQAAEAASQTRATIAREQAKGIDAQAEAMRRAADQERVNAGQEKAVAQRRAEQQRDAAAALTSRQRAAFAASGGGTTGSAAYIMGETEEKGEYNAELELWQGDERARALRARAHGMDLNAADATRQAGITRMGADADVFGTKQGRGATYINMASTILSGVGKMAGQMPVGSSGSSGPVIDYSYDRPSGWETTTRLAAAPSYVYGDSVG